EEVDALLSRIDALAESPLELDPRASGALSGARAFRAMATGDLGAALVGFEAAVAAYDTAGDRRAACSARSNVGFGLTELGAFAEAEEALRRAHTEAERLGLVEVAGTLLQNIGYAVLLSGRPGEARSLVERSIEILARTSSARLEGHSRTYLAQIH